MIYGVTSAPGDAAGAALLYADAREPPPPLRPLLTQIRGSFPPVSRPRPLGGDCERLAEAFSREVFG